MRRKGILTVFMTAFLVVAFAGMAFAAQNVVLKSDVAPIPQSTCYQAGKISWDLDNNTVLTNGDQMRFTLTSGVTLCKDINYYLMLHQGSTLNDGAIGTAVDPVTSTDPAANLLTLSGVVAGLTTDYGFVVRGTAGQTSYTVQVVARTKAGGVISATVPFLLTFTTGANTGDKLIIKFFDGLFNKAYKGISYHWKWGEPTGAAITGYQIDSVCATCVAPVVAFATGDNIICVNTSLAPAGTQYVEASPFSIPATIPIYGSTGAAVVFSGDYRIALIQAGTSVAPYSCKGAVPGHITYPATQTVCAAFDFETAGLGYCADHSATNRVILQSTQPFEQTNYIITAEILVNGLTGERGVYFANDGVFAQTYATATAACVRAGLIGQVVAGPNWRKADGSTAVPVAPIGACNAVAAAGKAVKFITTASSLGIADGTKYFLNIDLPSFNWNQLEVASGDVVTVSITVAKATCGTMGPFVFAIGTFGCGAAQTVSGTCVFPYFTSLNATDDYWNGIAIINTNTASSTAVLTAYKKDGSAPATYNATVPGNGMYSAVVSSIPWVGTTPVGVPVYITVTGASFSPMGFAMMGNFANHEAMGYITRP